VAPVRLDDVRGFVFDVDGSLVHRGDDFRSEPLPGAVEVLERIRESGRPLVLFTNGTHLTPASFARGLREDGLPIGDDEFLTPVCSAISHLKRELPGRSVMAFGSDEMKGQLTDAGIALTEGEDAEAVYVGHVVEVDLEKMKRAARAVIAGAPLLTANYGQGFWGSNGLVLSTGAMTTAAIAMGAGVEPTVVGKPSEAAIREVGEHLGVPTEEIAVIGDDIDMDIALGHLGGSRTILVRSGMSGSIDLGKIPEERHPDAVVDGVEQILPWL
jgi:HAD superfamily hydrolase (TIGR01450 family)